MVKAAPTNIELVIPTENPWSSNMWKPVKRSCMTNLVEENETPFDGKGSFIVDAPELNPNRFIF